MRRAVLALLVMASPAAFGLGGQNMVLGRIVVPRAEAPSVAVTTSPRSHYVLHCAGCHGVSGAGAPEKYVPDLRHLGQFLRVEGGREFIISVPGVMGSGLDDQQVMEMANWLLATMARDSVPEGLRPYTLAEVAKARATPMTDVAAVRRQLQDKARAQGLSID